jgi:hypothetical protein
VAVLEQHPGELAVRILQLLTFVVLTSFLIHRNSPESKDSDEEMQRSLNRIEKRLKSLEEAGEGGKTKTGSS